MHLTVAICTRNRSEMLRETLLRMRTLHIPAMTAWEILVIDNGSTDRTADVIEGCTSQLPIRCVLEPRGGLSHARNRAVDEAKGDYILWTDDDVLVDREWLSAYRRAFATASDAALFGGPISASFDGTLPPWLARTLPRVGGAFALRDLGNEPVRLRIDGRMLPFGANYAVRTAEQRRYPYRTELGHQPRNAAIVGEEVDVMARMLGDGIIGWWVPRARVQHRIPRERQTIRYLRRQLAGHGQYLAWQDVQHGHPAREHTIRAVRRGIVAELRYRYRRITSSPDRWIDDLIVASESWGWLRGRWLARQRDGPGASP